MTGDLPLWFVVFLAIAGSFAMWNLVQAAILEVRLWRTGRLMDAILERELRRMEQVRAEHEAGRDDVTPVSADSPGDAVEALLDEVKP